jgi:DNA-directed RNA polymerase subunit RPC12/RpoP
MKCPRCEEEMHGREEELTDGENAIKTPVNVCDNCGARVVLKVSYDENKEGPLELDAADWSVFIDRAIQDEIREVMIAQTQMAQGLPALPEVIGLAEIDTLCRQLYRANIIADEMRMEWVDQQTSTEVVKMRLVAQGYENGEIDGKNQSARDRAELLFLDDSKAYEAALGYERAAESAYRMMQRRADVLAARLKMVKAFLYSGNGAPDAE